MMRNWLRRLQAILIALLLCSMACTKTVQVPVLIPRTPCPLDPLPPFPELHVTTCGLLDCLPPGDAAAIYLWVKAARRHAEMAQVCVDDEVPPQALEPAAVHLELYQPGKMAQPVIDMMSFGGLVKVHLVVKDCGEVNAFYSDLTQDLILCNELVVADPQVTPFVVAHEMAHAVMDQLKIPYTGSPEEAADELAAVYLTVNDRAADVEAMALYWGIEDTDDSKYWDDHLPSARRAFNIACIADGYSDMWTFCGERWARAANHWYYLLTTALEGHDA